MSSRWFDGQLKQVASLVGVSTVLLTADFVGVLALVTGNAAGFGDRFPAYVLVMAIAFVITIVGLSHYGLEGRTVLSASTGVSVLALVTGTLAGEGLRYAVVEPATVFDVQLLFYLLAAGLIGTGLSFWTVNHWREFVRGRTVESDAHVSVE
ncbi:hypothetical protein [Halorarum salinum]|uniref:Uncharacterized protein n=1 Tax=Halorarum salinum TaxID=2743089 RepID=A0A7D5LD47_9EURY|nr:hypothetical protein [Halobaculum salinum]QLG63872.1 hypothetical protein HUG12_19965 [Halobaculum salinum]